MIEGIAITRDVDRLDIAVIGSHSITLSPAVESHGFVAKRTSPVVVSTPTLNAIP